MVVSPFASGFTDSTNGARPDRHGPAGNGATLPRKSVLCAGVPSPCRGGLAAKRHGLPFAAGGAKEIAMRVRGAVLPIMGAAALLICAACKNSAPPSGSANQSASDQVSAEQKNAEQSLKRAADAQKKAGDEQKEATNAQQDVQDAQRKLTEAQQKEAKQRTEAQQAQQRAQQEGTASQQQASQAQQRASQAQQASAAS